MLEKRTGWNYIVEEWAFKRENGVVGIMTRDARLFLFALRGEGSMFRRPLFVLAIALTSIDVFAQGTLTFEERVKAQEAIERVYYQHRIWPKENPQPKPPFEQMVPRAQIEAKVTDFLKKSTALEKFLQRPIQPEQLQAEMDRMAKGSKDPATLKELFDSLNNDPNLIAELLAAPHLVDRLISDQLIKMRRGNSFPFATDKLLLEGESHFKVYCPEELESNSSAPLDGRIEPRRSSLLSPYVVMPCVDSWSPTSTDIGVPSGRYQFCVVWTGAEMIVWGGYDASHIRTNTGGRYYPATDTWVPTSMGANLPSARRNPTAVWTGSEVLVWGGCTSSEQVNTGGRYNPVGDTWTPISTGTNVPSAREDHSAVWTGMEMIIWGGSDGWSYLNTGRRYLPASDSWIEMAMGSNCPAARSYHTAVWTGQDMVIWGGLDTSGYTRLNSGGRYRPATNSWMPTSIGANVPSGRQDHSAVWTGTEMIIWGGHDSSNPPYINTGGRYNPASDTWTATSVGTNVPSIRTCHSAVWTGSEMIVWGGEYYNPNRHFLSTGARYVPSADTWTPTSEGFNVPLARSWHKAVWTGGTMIIWGGITESIVPESGGIYTPSFTISGSKNLCLGQSTILNVIPAPGSILCKWFKDGAEIPGANAPSFTATLTGSYSAQVGEDATACTTPDFVLAEVPLPSPTISGDSSGCDNPGVSLSSQSFQFYQWMLDGEVIPGATSQSYQATSSGAYSVYVTDINGCSGVSPAHEVTIISSPDPTIVGPASACASIGGVLETESFSSYQWYRDSFLIPGATTRTYTATQSATYTVMVTGGNGCTATSAGFSFTAFTNPSPTITGPNPSCLSGDLTTQSFASYQWFRNGSIIPGAIGQTYSAPAPGTYTVFIIDTNGCSALSPGFVISTNPSPTITGPSQGCTIVTLSTGAYSAYQWNLGGSPISGATSQTYPALHSGTYTVTVTNSAGCLGTSAGKLVTIITPSVAGGSYNTCPATSVALSSSPAVTYQWNFNGAPIPGANSPTYAARVTGVYSVTTTDSIGCVATSVGHAVFVDFCSTSEVSPKQAIFPARLVKSVASSTGYYLYFQRLDTLDGYNAYEGNAGSWYSHSGAPGNVCDLAAMDLGTGEMRAEVLPSEGNHYYLVTAFAGSNEGPSGFDSIGNEILPARCAPYLTQICMASPQFGFAPLVVSFTTTATGGSGDYTWDWDFGDGSAHSSAQNPSVVSQ